MISALFAQAMADNASDTSDESMSSNIQEEENGTAAAQEKEAKKAQKKAQKSANRAMSEEARALAESKCP